MRTPTFLILVSLCLFGTLASAQNPDDFFNYKQERLIEDSLRSQNSPSSQQEIQQLIIDYRKRQAIAYYQAYQKRIGEQERENKLIKPQSHNQSATHGTLVNSTSSQGQVPDAVEYAAL